MQVTPLGKEFVMKKKWVGALIASALAVSGVILGFFKGKKLFQRFRKKDAEKDVENGVEVKAENEVPKETETPEKKDAKKGAKKDAQ